MFELNGENSMPSQVYNKWFSLDENTGIVRTTFNGENVQQQIDYEQFKEVLLGVDVLDSKTFDLIETVLVKISINDLNDNSPSFDLKYNYEVTLDEDTNATVDMERFITKVTLFLNIFE